MWWATPIHEWSICDVRLFSIMQLPFWQNSLLDSAILGHVHYMDVCDVVSAYSASTKSVVSNITRIFADEFSYWSYLEKNGWRQIQKPRRKVLHWWKTLCRFCLILGSKSYRSWWECFQLGNCAFSLTFILNWRNVKLLVVVWKSR